MSGRKQEQAEAPDAPRPGVGDPPAPPALAMRLLEARLGREDAEAFLGDLEEAFHERSARSPGRARLEFWREALAGLMVLRRRGPVTPPRRGWCPDTLLADLRLGARLLRRAPGYTLLVTATIALAIGAATAVFSVVDPLLLRPLPYARPDRLMTVWERDEDGLTSNFGWESYRDVAAATKTLESLAVTGLWQPTLTQGDDAERLEGARVSWSYFRMLGVHPTLGRDFSPEEDVPAAKRVVILSHRLWTTRFGANPALVGRTISLDGVPHTVAGVMAPGFEDVLRPEAGIWRVLGYDASIPSACRTCRHLRMVARLRPHVTPASARAELDRISAIMVAEHPRDYPAAGMLLIPAQAWVTRELRPILYAAAGAVALLLLLALANLTSLQVARLTRRDREFALRWALGASRGLLARQILSEGALAVVPGGIAGLGLAVVAVGLLRARLPVEVPRLAAMHVDAAAVGLALGLTLLLALVVAAGSKVAWAHAADMESVRSGARLVGRRRRLARAALVVAEVAVAVTLLQGAGLLSRTVLRLLTVDPGFDHSHLVTMEVHATGPRYQSDARIFAEHERLREAVRAVPGVIDVALASQLPLDGYFDRTGIRTQDHPLANPELAPAADRYGISGDYLKAMRIRILRGRDFTPAELSDSMPYVVVVSQTLARRLWPGESALGRRVRLREPDSPWRTVVGVSSDVRNTGLDDVLGQQIYIPERQWEGESQMVLVARTKGDPAALASLVRAAARSIDPTQPVIRVTTMDRLRAASVAQRALALALFGFFAAIALLMAGAGIYGVLAGAVAERTREIGVRLALGASPARVLRHVLGDGARLAGPGLLLGLAGAFAMGRLLHALLYGVAATDPLTLFSVALLLATIGAIACMAPAWRASAIDPAAALRAE